MSRLFATPERKFDAADPEYIDRADAAPETVREELRLLETANRRFGIHRLVLKSLENLLAGTDAREISVLDLATGSADIPRAIVDWARARDVRTMITALDSNPTALEFAKQSCSDHPEISLVRQDIRALAHEERSFDFVACSTSLHHFSKHDVVAILAGIHRIARRGYIVLDLHRSWLTVVMTELIALTAIRNPVFRADAIKSCRAAFSVNEMRGMVREAGLKAPRILRRNLGFHTVVEGRK